MLLHMCVFTFSSAFVKMPFDLLAIPGVLSKCGAERCSPACCIVSTLFICYLVSGGLSEARL